LFNRFTEFDVVPGRVGCKIAVLEERQDPVDPSGMVFGFEPLRVAKKCAVEQH